MLKFCLSYWNPKLDLELVLCHLYCKREPLQQHWCCYFITVVSWWHGLDNIKHHIRMPVTRLYFKKKCFKPVGCYLIIPFIFWIVQSKWMHSTLKFNIHQMEKFRTIFLLLMLPTVVYKFPQPRGYSITKLSESFDGSWFPGMSYQHTQSVSMLNSMCQFIHYLVWCPLCPFLS